MRSLNAVRPPSRAVVPKAASRERIGLRDSADPVAVVSLMVRKIASVLASLPRADQSGLPAGVEPPNLIPHGPGAPGRSRKICLAPAPQQTEGLRSLKFDANHPPTVPTAERTLVA